MTEEIGEILLGTAKGSRRDVEQRFGTDLTDLSWIDEFAERIRPYVRVRAEDGVLITSLVDRLIYWLCFYLSMLCLLWLMIETFRRYFGKAGRLWGVLKQNSYYVYIVHVIVLGSIGVLLLNAAIPSLLKYVILAGSTYAASNAIAWLGMRAVCGAARMRRP